jgi:hypothetical protein
MNEMSIFQNLIYLSEADIKDLGLKNGGQRAKIVSSLRLLKDRYERGITQSFIYYCHELLSLSF